MSDQPQSDADPLAETDAGHFADPPVVTSIPGDDAQPTGRLRWNHAAVATTGRAVLEQEWANGGGAAEWCPVPDFEG